MKSDHCKPSLFPKKRHLLWVVALDVLGILDSSSLREEQQHWTPHTLNKCTGEAQGS